MLPIESLADLTAERRAAILSRGRQRLAEVLPAVDAIIADVRARGDVALRDATRRFDGVELAALAVPADAPQAALAGAAPEYARALRQAAGTIERFHVAQLPSRTEPAVETAPGVRVWRAWRPIARVGIYVPGGGARYPSTVQMTAIPARIAGCAEIVICTPPGPDGQVPAELLAAVAVAGGRDEDEGQAEPSPVQTRPYATSVIRIFAVGGAQAIAALAYGTATIPRCDLIVGPGSAYVAAAKQRVAGDVAIDMPAGPSEVLIIADESAVPAWVAADLLAQAEHGPTSAPVLVTTSPDLAAAVARELAAQVADLATAATIRQSLARHGALLIALSLDAALDFANAYAPEHLELATRDPAVLLDRVANAGSVFLGTWSPEAAGDYATGANHTLPTGGFVRGFGPLSVATFGRWMQVQAVTLPGLTELRATIECLAMTEGLPAHAASVRARFAAAGVRPGEAEPSPLQMGMPLSSPNVRAPIRLNANENPYGASPRAREVVAAMAAHAGRYPDMQQRDLRAGLADYLGVEAANIIAGNGSDELIHLLTQAELGPDDEVIICEPTFSIYRFEAVLAGATIIDVPLDADFRFDLPAVLAAITPRTRLIWVCSPNNPTGTPFDLELLPALLAAGPRVVVDEAYYPFSDATALPLLQTLLHDDPARAERLVIMRTMSKIAGLAGLRIGYGIAAPGVIQRLDRRRHPFNVNAIAEAAALATLEDAAWMAQIKTAIARERERLAAKLQATLAVQVWPSEANFLLVGLPVADAGPVQRALAARGVLVRHLAQDRIRHCLRVTVGTPHEDDAFVAALATVAPEPEQAQ